MIIRFALKQRCSKAFDYIVVLISLSPQKLLNTSLCADKMEIAIIVCLAENF